MGTSSQRATPGGTEWNRAARKARAAVRQRTPDAATDALREFCKASGGLGDSGRSLVPIDPVALAKLLDKLLEFMSVWQDEGPEEALKRMGREDLAEQAAHIVVSALLDQWLEGWPEVVKDLVRAAILLAFKQATGDGKQATLESLGLAGLGAAGQGNLVNEILARILVTAYYHQVQEAVDADDADEGDQRASREQVEEAARRIVAATLEAYLEDLNDAVWGEAEDILTKALKRLFDDLAGGGK